MHPGAVIALLAGVAGPALALPNWSSTLSNGCPPQTAVTMFGSPGKTVASPFSKTNGADICKGNPPKDIPTVRVHPDYVSPASCGNVLTLMFAPLPTGQVQVALNMKTVEAVAWGKCADCKHRNQVQVDGNLWTQMFEGNGPRTQTERNGVWVSWGSRDAAKAG